ncbi:hypothetical protein JEODO184_01827 [Jeotgalicoccus meleagridis]|uniref:Uncharacterized protein n=2 Tax=Jeotgalicoccus meleagridis TaxID=2759181 RepID=A0A6V7RQ98_9STAP|nr:hypothetical protein JEODO184_01827 [Jeotgalicoccus meleagridis]
MGIYNAHAYFFGGNNMAMNLIQLFISVLLYFVLFYGISFILNMILKMTWIMAVVYPVIVLWIIGRVSLFDYIFSPGEAFTTLWENIIGISFYDIIILGSGLLGIILAGLTIRFLRKSGYQMF